MNEYLEANLDGFIFHIPVEIIKQHATAFLEDEASSQYPENYELREKFIRDGEAYWHHEGLTDWAQNNMDWDQDLEENAILVAEPEMEDGYELWARAKLKIIQKQD